jgi:electron transfer flavoprotein alpha subunit
MLCARSLLSSRRVIARAYASATSPHALVLLEHKDGVIESASLSALTAAQQLGGAVTGLVIGSPDQVPAVLESAKKYLCITLPAHPSFSEYLFSFQAEGTFLGPTFCRSTVWLQSA